MSEEKETEKKIASIYYLLFCLLKSYERWWWRSIVVRIVLTRFVSSRVLAGLFSNKAEESVFCSQNSSTIRNHSFVCCQHQPHFCLCRPLAIYVYFFVLFIYFTLFYFFKIIIFLHCVWRKNTDFFVNWPSPFAFCLDFSSFGPYSFNHYVYQVE